MKISYIRKVRYKGITEDVSNHMSLTRQLLYLSHIGKTFILILGTIIKAQHHIDCCFIYSTFQNQCGQIHHSFKQLVAISKYKCSIHKCWSCCCIVYTLLYIIIISMGGMNLQKKTKWCTVCSVILRLYRKRLFVIIQTVQINFIFKFRSCIVGRPNWVWLVTRCLRVWFRRICSWRETDTAGPRPSWTCRWMPVINQKDTWIIIQNVFKQIYNKNLHMCFVHWASSRASRWKSVE